jgi:hypothetical protein
MNGAAGRRNRAAGPDGNTAGSNATGASDTPRASRTYTPHAAGASDTPRASWAYTTHAARTADTTGASRANSPHAARTAGTAGPGRSNTARADAAGTSCTAAAASRASANRMPAWVPTCGTSGRGWTRRPGRRREPAATSP